MNLSAGQEQRHRRMDVWRWGGGGSGMDWEVGFSTCTLLCVKQTASGDPLDRTWSSAQGSAVTYRGGVGDGRRYVYTYS